MGDIYRKAALVHAWLGPDTWDSRLVFDKALELRFANPQQKEYHPWGDPLDQRTYWKHVASCKVQPAIRALLLRPYWTRLWVLQEMILAKDIMFTCGIDIMSLKDLERLCNVYGMRSAYTGDVTFNKGWFTFDKVCLFRSHDSPHWGSVFTFFSHHECSDLKDKVYGLQQLLASPDSIPVDYSRPVLTAYMDLLRTGLLRQHEGINSALNVLASMRETCENLALSVWSMATNGFAPVHVLKSFYVTAYTDFLPFNSTFDLQISFEGINLPPLLCLMRRGRPSTYIAVGDIISLFGSSQDAQKVSTILVLRRQHPEQFTYVAGLDQLLSYSQGQNRTRNRCYCTGRASSPTNTLIEVDRQAVSNILSKQSWHKLFLNET